MLYPATCVGLRYGCRGDNASGFSWKYDYPRCRPPPEGRAYYRGSALAADFPAAINAYARQRAVRQRAEVSLLRHRVAPNGSHGMLTVMPSASPLG